MSLRDLIFQNLWLKLFSIMMATLIWLAVAGNESADGPVWRRVFRAESIRTFDNIPIMVMTDMGDRRSFSMEPSTASIRVQGTKSLLPQITEGEIHLFVRVGHTQAVTGPFLVEMQPIHGISAHQILPPTVFLRAADSP